MHESHYQKRSMVANNKLLLLIVSLLFLDASSVHGGLLVPQQNAPPCNLTIRASFHANTYVTGTKIFVSKKNHFVIKCISSSTLPQQAIYRFTLNGTGISTRISRSYWLPINFADFSDEGKYSCSASVGNTTCVSPSLFVRVLDAPKVALFPPDGMISATLKNRATGAFVNATACLLNPLEAGSLRMFTLRWIHEDLHLNALGSFVTPVVKDNCVTLIIQGAGKSASGELVLKMTNQKTDASADFQFSIKIVELISPTNSSSSFKLTTSEALPSQSASNSTPTIEQKGIQELTTAPDTRTQKTAPAAFSTLETPTELKKNGAGVIADAVLILTWVGISVALALIILFTCIACKLYRRSIVRKSTTNGVESGAALSPNEKKDESLAEPLPLSSELDSVASESHYHQENRIMNKRVESFLESDV